METARLFVRVLRVCVTMIKTSGFYSSFFFFFNTNGSNEREEKLDERPGREVDIKGFEKEGTEKGNELDGGGVEWRETGRRRKAGQ